MSGGAPNPKVMGEGQQGFSPEESRVAEFSQQLGELAVVPLSVDVDISQLKADVRAGESFMQTDYRAEPTFYVASPELARSKLTGFVPFISRGGQASGHGVFFGALTFEDEAEVPVAVKPHFVNGSDPESYRQARQSCLKDYFSNVAAKKCGLESLEPIGFVMDEDSRPYSLTLLDESLTTLDSIGWTRYFEPGFETGGMRELLFKVALQAASLHDTGDSFHGDLAPRNVATNLYGHVFFIDWEYGRITTAPASDLEERFGKTWKDIKALMVDMIKPPMGEQPGIGLFTHCQGSWWENFKEIFLDDYMEARKQLAQQGSHHMRRLKDTKAEMWELERALYLEIEKWQHGLRPDLAGGSA